MVPVTTDNLGNATFIFPPPSAWNLAVQCTLSVNSGGAGTFEAFLNGAQSLGQWSGGATVGPFTYQGSQQLSIKASGLSPNKQYVASAQGIADYLDALDNQVASVAAPGLAGTDSIIDVTLVTLAAGVPQLFEWFPTINWAALRLSAGLISGGPVLLEATWANAKATADMGYRRYVIGTSAPDVFVVVPHLGDQLQLKATAPAASGALLLESGSHVLLESGSDILLESGIGGAAATLALLATHSSQPVAAFGGDDIISATGVSVTNGTTVVVLAPPFVFGGPAQLEFDPDGMASAYLLEVQKLDEDGTWRTFVSRNSVAVPVPPIEFFCPAQPIRVQVTNNTMATHTATATLEYDLHRVG